MVAAFGIKKSKKKMIKKIKVGKSKTEYLIDIGTVDKIYNEMFFYMEAKNNFIP